MREVILLVLIYHVVSQPVSDELSRPTRELIECCPCPGKEPRSRADDDCPCRPRSADSEGASSMFSPRILHSNIPFLRSNDPNDDQKNLLEPEVGLATSMLQTLREATEEEYRDALARDAAKVDAVPEESARNVVIIVKPRSRASDNEDSFIAEESNLKESRCIHPLGGSLGKMKTLPNPLKVLPDIFGLPKAKNSNLMHRNIWDMDSNIGASNVQESVIGIDEDLSEFKQHTPSLTFRPQLKYNAFKGNGLKGVSAFDKLEQSLNSRPNLFERFNLPAIPKLKLDKPLKNAKNDLKSNNDLSLAPNNQEATTIDTGESKFNKKPPLLRNLLKLKDVELIPKSILKRPMLKANTNTKILSLPTSINSDDKEDSSYDSAMNENLLLPNKRHRESDDPQNIVNKNRMPNLDCSTEIVGLKENQDALTSPSEIIPTVLPNNAVVKEVNSAESDCDELSSEEQQSSTSERDNSQKIDETDNETLNTTNESEIETAVNKETEQIFSQECENKGSLDIENDDLDNDNNNINIITTTQTNDGFLNTNIQNNEPEFLNSDETLADSSCDRDDEGVSNLSSIDEIQIITPKSSEADKITITKFTPISTITESLSTFKNNVAKRFEDLKIPKIKAAKFLVENNDKQMTDITSDKQKELMDNPTAITDNLKESKGQEKSSQVTFKDLEDLSNDLLVLSSNNEQLMSPKSVENEVLREEPVFAMIQDSDEIVTTNNEHSESDNLGDTLADNDKVISKEKVTNNVKEKSNQMDFLSKLTQKTTQKYITESQSDNSNEMNVEASDSIASTLPVYLDSDNLNEKLKSHVFTELDPLNLNTKLKSPLFQNIDSSSMGASSETSQLQGVVQQPTIPQDPLNILEHSNTASVSDAVKAREISTNRVKEKGCRSGFQSERIQKTAQQFEPVSQPEDDTEMVVEASAPIGSTLPVFLDPLNLNEKLKSSVFTDLNPVNLNHKLESSLFKNIDAFSLGEQLETPIFQGVDLDPLNLNQKLRSSLQDILRPTISQEPLNLLGKQSEVLKLSTVEEQQRLTDVFDTNNRNAEVSEEDIQCSNIEPVEMSSAASTTNIRKVPTVRPLEDFNVDIFQLKPLSSSHPNLSSKIPRLNLNNFRAKLPIPDNLDLKPLKLESRVGNDKGILGASLSFGSDKSKSRKTQHGNLNSLGSRLGSLPTFDELRSNFHTNTQKLLGKSLRTNLDLFNDSPLINTGLPNVDEVRRNAEKTMKGLQQRMKSTLKGGSSLSENFARPQDLLEDVNDKLKAIHYDLNDRLSSIHESIIDQSPFKPLTSTTRIPTFPTKNTNQFVMKNFRKSKGKPARLQSSSSTILSQENDPLIDTHNSFSSLAKNGLKKVQINPQKNLFGAESSHVPTKVEFLQPRYSTEFPLSERSSNLKQDAEKLFSQVNRGKSLSSLSTNPSLIKDLKRPNFRKPNPFKDKTSKVTITFAATTVSPFSAPSNEYQTTTPDISTKPKSESIKERLAAHTRKFLGDAKQSPSEIISSKVPAPVKSKNNFKTTNSDIIDDYPQLQSLKPSDIKPRLPSFKDKKDFKLRENRNGAFGTTGKGDHVEATAQNPKPLVWPKSGEDSFLAKVREAMQARLASFDPANTGKPKVGSSNNLKAPAKVEKVDNTNTDMARSASENNGMILIEPLKENVSFKCKMVCTRE